MYLSRKNNFLLIAVPRTASNSAHQLLREFVPPTPIDSYFGLHPQNPPYQRDQLARYHATPQSIVLNNWMTREELDDINAFGFVRDPVERWVSSFYLARASGRLKVNPTFDHKPFIEALIDDDIVWPFRKPVFVRQRMTDYFYINDKQVVDAYDWRDFAEVIGDLTGQAVTDVPHVSLGDGVPEEYRRPIDEWLSPERCEKLRRELKDDIAFYEKNKR